MENRYRNFCFTRWNCTPIDSLPKGINFLIYQLEQCPTTGKLHFQGYAQCEKKIGLNKIKDLFNDKSMHIEEARGSAEDNIKYCSKDKSRVEGTKTRKLGEPKVQGKRSDLDLIWESIEEGMTMKEILHTHKGKALRVVNAIQRALISEHEASGIDRLILRRRENLETKDKDASDDDDVDGTGYDEITTPIALVGNIGVKDIKCVRNDTK